MDLYILTIIFIIIIILLFLFLIYNFLFKIFLFNNIDILILILLLINFIIILIKIDDDNLIYISEEKNGGLFAHLNSSLINMSENQNKRIILMNYEPLENINFDKKNKKGYEYSDPFSLILKKFIFGIDQNLFENQLHENYENTDKISKRRIELNKIFHKNFKINEDILKIADNIILNPSKTLGVHIRAIIHYMGSKNINFDNYIKEYFNYIDNKLENENYENIFLATHLKDVLDLFKKKYGNKLLYYEHYLNDDKNSDWTNNNISLYEERKNVLIDMLLLSKCDEIIGGPSNVMYSAFWYNPKVKVKILDILKIVGY